jgi:hypothetical protein
MCLAGTNIRNFIMKKLALIALLFVSTAAMAQTPPPTGGNPPPPVGGGQGGEHGDGQHFQEMKAKILQRIGDHMAEVQKRQACVEAANDGEALRACLPERKDHGQGGPGGGPNGQGGEGNGGGMFNGFNMHGGQNGGSAGGNQTGQH